MGGANMAAKGFEHKIPAILSTEGEVYNLLLHDNEDSTVRTLTA